LSAGITPEIAYIRNSNAELSNSPGPTGLVMGMKKIKKKFINAKPGKLG